MCVVNADHRFGAGEDAVTRRGQQSDRIAGTGRAHPLHERTERDGLGGFGTRGLITVDGRVSVTVRASVVLPTPAGPMRTTPPFLNRPLAQPPPAAHVRRL